MTRLIALVLILSAAPLAAQTPLSAEDFEAYTTGKTLYFGLEGEEYGAEEYLPNRRVRWSFLDGDCKDGYWYERDQDQAICFVYDDILSPQCWHFYQSASGLRATFDGSDDVFYEALQTGEPMYCMGPDVGV